jgi:hypothetical protein
MRSLAAAGMGLFTAGLVLVGCQNPTSSSSSVSVDDYVDASYTPNPATAVVSTDGKTYRVVRGNNQPDDIYPYQFVTSFAVTVTINGRADDKDVNLAFPVKLTAVTVVVHQASGGIVSVPTGGETEHYDFVITNSTGSTFGGVNTSQTTNLTVWYALPNSLREALAAVSFAFQDNDGVSFTRTVNVQIAP